MVKCAKSASLLCLGFLLQWAAHAAPLHITAAQFTQINGHGYSSTAVELTAEEPTGDWQAVQLPHATARRILPLSQETANPEPPTTDTWYRMALPMHAWRGEPRYLYIPRWKMDGLITVYVNRRIVYQNDSTIRWNGANTPLWIALDKNLPVSELAEVSVHIQHPRLSGGGISSMWIGSFKEINWRYRLRMLLQSEIPNAFSSAFLAIGIFSFFLWLRLREEKGYLLFFAISVGAYIRTLHYYVGITKLPLPESWFTWLTVNSLFWMLLIIHVFLNYLHRRPSRWLNRFILATVAFFSVITLPFLDKWVNAYEIAPITYIALLAVGALGSIYGWRQSVVAKSSDGKLLAAWSVLGMILGMYDMLLLSNLISLEFFYISPFSNIGFFAILLRIIYRRYIAKHDEVIAINSSLQDKLLARENELEKTHQRLREIEMKRQLVEERQRLMQDMHDGMGSNLRSALLAVETGTLSSVATADILKDCIDDLKLTIDSMEPMDADLLLLLATFRYRLAPRLESAGIHLVWDIGDIPKLKWLNPNSALHILRILQEAMTNIVKHAHATEIRVATQMKIDRILITVRDNGCGFTQKPSTGFDGRGLENQKRRAESMNSHIHWQSDQHGTLMTLDLPITTPLSSKADKSQTLEVPATSLTAASAAIQAA